jgi:hypothetical protein
MCNFFSIVTEPENHGGRRFYFDWVYRKEHLTDDTDSHSRICKFFKLDEDDCNKYEYNPLTKTMNVDQINSSIDDRVQVEQWFTELDFKTVVEPLVVKPIVNPLSLPQVDTITEEQIQWLKVWASVWDSVGDSVWASVGDSVWDSVGDSVRASVGASVWAYISSFVATQYDYDFTAYIKLWEAGLVPSFDGTTWRLHSGTAAKIVYSVTTEDLAKL